MTIDYLNRLRKNTDIHMLGNQMLEIVKTIERPVDFLIFGLGNDSVFWSELNKTGRTVFIEDNHQWYKKTKDEYPFLEAYLVEYRTKKSEWKNLINCPEKLCLSMPDNILNMKWDRILVDAPNGFSADSPGRMKSIYMASIMAKDQADIFIHDCQRKVERKYCNKYFIKKNLIKEVRGIGRDGITFLRHYK